MLRGKTATKKTTFGQKIILVLFGLFIGLLAVEVAMRIGGVLLLSTQEYRNRNAVYAKGTYRIMCLGESTTAGGKDSYPRQLEDILNQSGAGVKFSVINKGIPAITTPYLVAQLEDKLNRYKPDMVICMIGINDLGMHMRYSSTYTAEAPSLLKSLKIYNLVRFIRDGLINRQNKAQAFKCRDAVDKDTIMPNMGILGLKDSFIEETKPAEAVQPGPGSAQAYIELGRFYYIRQGDYGRAEASLKKAVEAAPDDYRTHFQLGLFWADQGEYSNAENAFKKAISLNPGSGLVYTELGWSYKEHGDYWDAGQAFRNAVDLDPDNTEASIGLGQSLTEQGRYEEAERVFRKAIERKPNNCWLYLKAGEFYADREDFPQAEAAFKKAIGLNPLEVRSYVRLGWCYREQEKYQEAEEAFKKAAALMPDHNNIRRALLALDNERNDAESRIQRQRVAKQFYQPFTKSNYRKIKAILDDRGIKLVCVQYPMCSIEPLKQIFAGESGIIFVDNEHSFKEAVKKSRINMYFKDMFAGNFGHCTRLGNRLLAENVASAVIKNVLKIDKSSRIDGLISYN